MIRAMDGFKVVGEVTADDRGRISIGKAGVGGDDRFAMAINDEGDILLTPVATIPKRELILWENKQLMQSLLRGMEQAAEGDVQSRGSFARFAEHSE